MSKSLNESRAEQSRAEQSRAEQSRAEQSRAEQSRAEQSRAEQSRAEQSRAEQSRAEQSRAEQIQDYITGKLVHAKPEEIDAVQPFSKKLVEDYGYPKSHIKTHPQFKVKRRPSDNKKSYPVDIAVFSSEERTDNNIMIIVECKAKTETEGRTQLENYLTLSRANLGVWFNGNGFIAMRKYERNGNVFFEDIPDIPKFGERLEDIGQYKRKDLITPHNIINEFRAIRNYLAGNAKGMTNDASFAQEVINVILCKLYDEKYTEPENKIRFRAGYDESTEDVLDRIMQIFQDTKKEYSDVFENEDNIKLDDKSITYLVGKIQKFSLLDADRDVVADAFEVFIGPSLRGAQGQFFTPRNIVKTVIEIIDPKPNEYIIDPACGSGGFLSECLRYIHKKIEIQGKKLKWSEGRIKEEKIQKVTDYFSGIEKDAFLSKVAKAYMIILGDGKSGIKSEDALDLPKNWSNETNAKIKLGMFDVVITNPPFGSKIPVEGKEKLSQFELCHKWNEDTSGIFSKGDVLESQSPQIAFIDRCLDFLKEGGRMGIVLPDGVLSNTSEKYIRYSLSKRVEIIGIVDLPMNAFMPSTPTKTHLFFVRKKSSPDIKHELFMSYAKTCGHDKRGMETPTDDIRLIPIHLKKLKNSKTEPSNLGVFVNAEKLKNGVWLPKYYNAEIDEILKTYKKNNYEIISIGKMIDNKIIAITSGHEIGSKNYGIGSIPFIRTSEIGNLEIMTDTTHGTSEEVYAKYKDRQNIQNEDILMVSDGTYLIGRCAMVTDLDIKIIIQSHFKQIKVVDRKKLSPYLLLALINLDIVQKQLESKSFRQGTISTIGDRLNEIRIPIPKDEAVKKHITDSMKEAIKEKRKARKKLLNFEINSQIECFMGIKNRGTQGNL